MSLTSDENLTLVRERERERAVRLEEKEKKEKEESGTQAVALAHRVRRRVSSSSMRRSSMRHLLETNLFDRAMLLGGRNL